MNYLKRFNESISYDFIEGSYTINSDGSIDVDGNVELYGKDLIKLPVKFNIVSGNFNISQNNLDTLDGSPEHVGGDFYCYENILTSLKYSPKYVGKYFHCSENKLTSLEYSPEHVGGRFMFYDNDIWNFNGIGVVKGESLINNYTGSSIKENQIDCTNAPICEIYKLCPTMEFVKYLNEFTPIRGNTILGKRLQDCLYMCDIDYIDVTTLSFKNYTLLE